MSIEWQRPQKLHFRQKADTEAKDWWYVGSVGEPRKDLVYLHSDMTVHKSMRNSVTGKLTGWYASESEAFLNSVLYEEEYGDA